MRHISRMQAALQAALIHLLGCIGIGLLAAVLVFGLWYPFPYRELSGGRELFLLVVSADIVCGPLLTLVLFSPTKRREVLSRELGIVIAIQLLALSYGLWSVWQARPLFLVAEVDRFKVVAAADVDNTSLRNLPASLQPSWLLGPRVVAIREPLDNKEREKVLIEAAQGGRDYAERPEFYSPYQGEIITKTTRRAKPLVVFLQKQPSQWAEAQKLAKEKNTEIAQWFYLPIVARQDWVAIVDNLGQIQGFLKGDGF